ncbi:FAD-binding and (Fe-S)-binding domain-containing protein [uncultured Nocardioides sp.]|uniref:FAD-binding and (Fe-S)-binding domain-containing protein n=1 Tax=uncultured Nocardioides sp. TaxID=198441 RepID=UPI00260BF2EF|nr:FAD-binding and (Fe-S)-binding domain-containing protein [uncultured Nocardioides sp.]
MTQTTVGPAGLATRLSGVLGPGVEVSGRALDLRTHAHDASHYLLHPQALATPRDLAQVAEVMRACTRLGVPLTFRSGGTSLSGQALSDSVLVDVRAGFTGIEVLDEGARVRVQPGATVRAVNTRLARHRRALGPDPASEVACTLGGVLANNSSGMQCGTERNSYRTCESMVLVLPSGTVLDTAAPDADELLRTREPDLYAGLLTLRDRVRGNPDSVATVERLFALKNTMGYGLNSFLDHDTPAAVLARLMVGSEGTLGFVASAVFRTVPVLPHTATGLLVADDLATAATLVPDLLATGVVTAELLDAAALRVAQADPGCPDQIRRLDVREHAALLVELQAESVEELEEARRTAEPGLAALPLTEAADLTSDPASRASLWRTRKGLYSAVASARPQGTNALLEDVAVPVGHLAEMCRGLTGLFGDHSYEGSVIFGHARDGNLHFLLAERFDDDKALRRYEEFTTDMVDLVLGLGGTLKAEHGTGRIMAPFVERQYGAELTDVMREVKRLCDPAGILNPGSVLTDDPDLWLRDLKTAPRVEDEVDRCVECGFCEPICPSRSLTMTPRQRIVGRREIADAEARGEHDVAQQMRDDYTYDGVETCAADSMCATACPVLIDTGQLVKRLRAEDAPGDRAWTAAADRWDVATRAASAGLGVASKVPGLAAGAARLGRRLLGADVVPLTDPELGAGGARREVLDDPAAEAVLFTSCTHTMFGGEADGAVRALCERAGVRLRTPADLPSLCCGTPWSSKGHEAGHARMAEKLRTSLEHATDGGRLPVLVDAGSCTEGVVRSLGDAGVRVEDATTFVRREVLPRLTVTGSVPAVVVHPTCASTTLGTTDDLVALARACSADVRVPDAWGCCAFAGDRGLLHPELTASATAPEAAEVAAMPLPSGAAYVSVNRTCEIGMTRATGESYRHVLELLADLTA